MVAAAHQPAGIDPPEQQLAGRLVGVIAVNRRKEVRAAMKLIEHRAEVGLDQLADDTVELRKLRPQRR